MSFFKLFWGATSEIWVALAIIFAVTGLSYLIVQLAH